METKKIEGPDSIIVFVRREWYTLDIKGPLSVCTRTYYFRANLKVLAHLTTIQ